MRMESTIYQERHSAMKKKHPGTCSHVQIVALALSGCVLLVVISSVVAYAVVEVLQKSYPDNTFSVDNLVHENTDNDKGLVVIQRRRNGKENFTRTWKEYKDGFGSRSGDMWFGNENIHILTQRGYNRLLIKLTTFDDESYLFEYDHFNMSGENDKYRLYVYGYHPDSSGMTRDCLQYHNEIPFSTYDRDNDKWREENCAVVYRGGWWYDYCQEANLNGQYRSWGEYRRGEMIWCGIDEYVGIRYTQMMLKKIS